MTDAIEIKREKRRAYVRAYMARWRKTEEGKAASRRYTQKYLSTDKGRLTKTKYLNSAQYKRYHKDYFAAYNTSAEGKPARKRYQAKYRRSDKGRLSALKLHLRTQFGITYERYAEMLQAQGGHCALCAATPPKGRRLDVDHDHKTGKVRGLLCRNCNMGIGYLKESSDILHAAVAYLKEPKL